MLRKTALPKEMTRDPLAIFGEDFGPIEASDPEIVLEPEIAVRRLLAITIFAFSTAGKDDNDVVA